MYCSKLAFSRMRETPKKETVIRVCIENWREKSGVLQGLWIPGTGVEVLQKIHKFRVGTGMLYRYPYPHPSTTNCLTCTSGIVPPAYIAIRSYILRK